MANYNILNKIPSLAPHKNNSDAESWFSFVVYISTIIEIICLFEYDISSINKVVEMYLGC